MRQPLVIGNWKMHGSESANEALLAALAEASFSRTQLAVCPPLLFIAQATSQLSASSVKVGAQNLCALSDSSGAYTGEVSAQMLAEYGVSYVLVGHSERREYFSESDEIVGEKFAQAQAKGLLPVLCVGESLEQRKNGEALAFVEQQLKAVIDKVGIKAFENAVVAYEPIWAIGTGETASPEQAQEVHAHIRSVFKQYDANIAENLQLLYGGSVKADNAASLFSMDDIDGALVGGASLKSEDFIAIGMAAE